MGIPTPTCLSHTYTHTRKQNRITLAFSALFWYLLALLGLISAAEFRACLSVRRGTLRTVCVCWGVKEMKEPRTE